jgi:hypothetical protein
MPHARQRLQTCGPYKRSPRSRDQLLLILDFVAGYLGFSALRSATNSGTALFKLTVLGWQFARISCVLSFSRASMITSKGLLGRSRSLCHRFLVARISHPEFPNHSPQPIRFTALDYLKLSNLLKRGSEYQATDQFVEQEQLQRVRRRGGTSPRHFFCPIRRIAAGHVATLLREAPTRRVKVSIVIFISRQNSREFFGRYPPRNGISSLSDVDVGLQWLRINLSVFYQRTVVQHHRPIAKVAITKDNQAG